MKVDIVGYQNNLIRLMIEAKGINRPVDPVSIISGDKIYQINSAWIDFLDPLPSFTKIPRTDSMIKGTCHSRGRVLIVFDLTVNLNNSQSKAKLIVFKGRDIAIIATLANQDEINNFEKIEFTPDIFGEYSKYFSHLL